MAEEKKQEKVETSKEEQIGFHKGALSTLAKEREELARILNIVEQLMQMHIKGLQELGVDLTKEQSVQGAKQEAPKKPDKPIDQMI